MGCCVSKTATAVIAPTEVGSSNYVNGKPRPVSSSRKTENQGKEKKKEKSAFLTEDQLPKGEDQANGSALVETKTKKQKGSQSEISSNNYQLSNNDLDLIRSTATDLQPFPNPQSVPILLITPPSNLFMKIEDTFWEKKRQLIPNYKILLPLDEHVTKVTKTAQMSLRNLVCNI